jgi:Fe-S-cluster containining protein
MDDAKPIETPFTLMRPRDLTLKQKFKLIRGKVHRFYVCHFNKTYVARHLAKRHGECKRCGACCQLLFRCAFAAECKDGAGCKIYKRRPINCRVFPLHKRDLQERDIVSPETKCGYYFK